MTVAHDLWFASAAALLAGTLVVAVGCGDSGAGGGAPATPTAAPPALDVPFDATDLREGSGAAAEDGWLVAIAYTGWVYDPAATDNRGSEFASASPEEPFSFRLGVGQVIAGVDRGVAGMRVGGLRRVVVPPELGFGVGGNTMVPANATLLLEIELLAGAAVPFSTTDLHLGEGEEATNGRSLSVSYRGWLFDLTAPENKGSLFDSTTAEAPFRFTLGAGSVIEGWDLGVAGMRVGGRRRLVIPHELAYGTTGSGAAIPGFATLLFEVELLSVD